jgi:hypothetical protein
MLSFVMVSIRVMYLNIFFGLYYVRTGNSSLPVIRQAMLHKRIAEDTNLDRLTLWQQTVESKCSRKFNAMMLFADVNDLF